MKQFNNNKIVTKKSKLPDQYRKPIINPQNGFTLMEIIVATTIFVLVSGAMMTLFNYTLKINRRSEALRQATQGMRNFAEFFVKEVRDGRINYFVESGIQVPDLGPCRWGGSSGGNFNSSYAAKDNRLSIVNSQGETICFYLGYGPGNTGGHSVGTQLPNNQIFTNTADNPNPVLAMLKRNAASVEVLNPPNFRIENLMFVVRPICDPYSKCTEYSNATPKLQPFVSILMKFSVQLPTGEQYPIYYQTAVTTDDYNVPGS